MKNQTRICRILWAIELIIESCTCSAVWVGNWKLLPNGGATSEEKVRWWNPASWIAWFRTVVLRDDLGCAYYRKTRDPESENASTNKR